jgi:predicted NUDIX family phosphoesterase
MSRERVLVAPASAMSSVRSFSPFPESHEIFESLSQVAHWATRPSAERSTRLIQPIPCAVIVDSANRYCVFRRTSSTRRDLRGLVTLVVGGHIDKPVQHTSFEALVVDTLKRELEEEVGLRQYAEIDMLGLVIDRTTAASARHFGIIYRIKVRSGRIRPLAHEEFSSRSKYSGTFLDVPGMLRLYPQFDAWSASVFENVLSPGSHITRGMRRQLNLPLAL